MQGHGASGVVLQHSDRMGAGGEDCLQVQWVNSWTWVPFRRAAKVC